MAKGLIVIGYQGIGKSSCAGIDGCVDLESGNFYIGDQRNPEWYIPYCQIAMHLADQGYTVFVSSHLNVVQTLKTMPRMPNVGGIVIFCPRHDMKYGWIQRLRNRYEKSQLWKDKKALDNAAERYDDSIDELYDSGLPIYQPYALDYDLMNYIHRMRRDWCSVPPHITIMPQTEAVQ